MTTATPTTAPATESGAPATAFVGFSFREYARYALRPANRSSPSSKLSKT